MDAQTIPDLLKWLMSSAGLIAVASFLMERVPWFQQQTPKRRQVIIFALVVLIPQVALILLQVVPPQVWADLQPYWQAFSMSITVLVTLAASEAAHHVDKRLSRKEP